MAIKSRQVFNQNWIEQNSLCPLSSKSKKSAKKKQRKDTQIHDAYSTSVVKVQRKIVQKCLVAVPLSIQAWYIVTSNRIVRLSFCFWVYYSSY